MAVPADPQPWALVLGSSTFARVFARRRMAMWASAVALLAHALAGHVSLRPLPLERLLDKQSPQINGVSLSQVRAARVPPTCALRSGAV